METTRNVKNRIKALYESVGRGFESLPSHQEKPVHVVCWFFFFGAKEGLNSNDDDRCLRQKQGGVVEAAF